MCRSTGNTHNWNGDHQNRYVKIRKTNKSKRERIWAICSKRHHIRWKPMLNKHTHTQSESKRTLPNMETKSSTGPAANQSMKTNLQTDCFPILKRIQTCGKTPNQVGQAVRTMRVGRRITKSEYFWLEIQWQKWHEKPASNHCRTGRAGVWTATVDADTFTCTRKVLTTNLPENPPKSEEENGKTRKRKEEHTNLRHRGRHCGRWTKGEKRSNGL